MRNSLGWLIVMSALIAGNGCGSGIQGQVVGASGAEADALLDVSDGDDGGADLEDEDSADLDSVEPTETDVASDAEEAGPADTDVVDVPLDVDDGDILDDAAEGEVELPEGEGEVLLNEALARNGKGLTDDDGKTSDWIELYNPGDGPMHLEGWALTDEAESPQKWVFPDVSIPPGGYLLVFASGKDRRNPQAALHTNFKLSASGEFLGLSDPEGVIVQDFGPSYPFQLEDISYGNHVWPGLFYLNPPTPGASNVTSVAAVGLGEVSFSRPPGVFTEAFELTLSGPPADQLRVTLDGTEPTAESPAYSGPIMITATTQVRVAIVEEDEDPRFAAAVYVLVDSSLAAFESELPVLVLDSFGFDIDEEAWLDERPFRPLSAVVVDDASAGLEEHATWSGVAAMHVRGSSSTQYDKKQYTFETRDARDRDLAVGLLGMPPDSDWVLHAPYSDKSLMRNAMIYQWSNAIGRYAVRTRFVELFVAPHGGAVTLDDYRGVYVVMEKIKQGEARVDVAELDKDHVYEPEISGGYILKKDWYDEGFDTLIFQDHLIWVYPEADEIEEEQKAWVSGFFNAFEAALAGTGFTNPWTGYAAFIDVDSFIDHHLLVEMARNVDGFVLSTYLHKDREGRIHMGPIWDYNGALGGANYFCSWEIAGWHHEFNEVLCGDGGETFPADNPSAYGWYERLFEDPAFAQRYAERWQAHRQGPLATAALHAAIDNAVAELGQAPTRNFERWPVLGQYVWPNADGWAERLTFEQEVAYLKTWLQGRLEWMDSQLVPAP